jgi:hypothetical protein
MLRSRFSKASNSIELPTRCAMSLRGEARCFYSCDRSSRSLLAAPGRGPLRCGRLAHRLQQATAKRHTTPQQERGPRAGLFLVRRSCDSHGRADVLMGGRRRIRRRLVGDGAPGRFMGDRRGSCAQQDRCGHEQGDDEPPHRPPFAVADHESLRPAADLQAVGDGGYGHALSCLGVGPLSPLILLIGAGRSQS